MTFAIVPYPGYFGSESKRTWQTIHKYGFKNTEEAKYVHDISDYQTADLYFKFGTWMPQLLYNFRKRKMTQNLYASLE